MSQAAALGPSKHAGTRFLQALTLAALFALFYGATRVVPEIHAGVGTIAAVGFLLLAGTLMSELVETIRVPHLTGYLIAGIIAGPYVLKLIDHESSQNLSFANSLALSLIALEGGAELRIATLRRGLKSVAWAIFTQCFLVLVSSSLIFLAIRPMLPFVRGLGLAGTVATALLWGVMGVTRSPSAVLGVLSQTRAKGPIATFTLSFVMLSDVIVVVLLATCTMIAQALVDPIGGFSFDEIRSLGREILGSVAFGTSLGLVLAAYVRLVGRQLLLVFLALGFGASEVLRYLQYDPLLSFMVAGFVVQNLSKQGEHFLRATQQMGAIVYVVFFATAGVHLDLPLLRQLWPAAVTLAAGRALMTWIAARLANRLADDPPELRRWGYSGLISQAGLALGLASLVARKFPTFGAGFGALAIATIAINEMFGPILFKLALDRTGETSTTPEATRTSLLPPPP